MSIEIRLVGGPADGRTYAIPDTSPPHLHRIPIATPMTNLSTAAPLEPSPTQIAEYQPLLENGRFRRTDDGAYLYQHRPVPTRKRSQ